ncbi:hypothetical protein [Millionella massiliensis]|uniref:hypothetical protein n=1 Tax=Millionella massiliensis TaxID=1871023 RepID=UPI0023A7BD82|nr:hypothetical protein [Millionella massiliensis]
MKYLSIIKYALLIVSTVLVIIGTVTFSDVAEVNSGLDTMLIWGLVMVVLAVVAVILMPLLGVVQNPKSAKRALVGLGALVVVVLVSYALATDEPIKLASGKVMDDSFDLIFSDTALWALYITFAGAIISILATEFYKVFKK